MITRTRRLQQDETLKAFSRSGYSWWWSGHFWINYTMTFGLTPSATGTDLWHTDNHLKQGTATWNQYGLIINRQNKITVFCLSMQLNVLCTEMYVWHRRIGQVRMLVGFPLCDWVLVIVLRALIHRGSSTFPGEG